MVNTHEPCDPSETDDPDIEHFLDSIETIFPSIVSNILDDYLENLTDSLANLDCDDIRGNVIGLLDNLESNGDFNRAHVAGENDEFILENMSQYFTTPPTPMLLNSNDRSEDHIELESKHIELYQCDKLNIILTQFLSTISETTEEKLLEYLNSNLENITSYQVEKFKNDPQAFNIWIISQLSKYINEELGIGFLLPKDKMEHQEPTKYSRQSPYHSVVYNGHGNPFINDQHKRETKLKEIAWLYNQGFEEIFGIERVFYLEELVNQRMLGGGDETGSVLPAKITNYVSGSYYDIYLDKIKITPSGAHLDAFFLFTDPKSGKRISFSANNIQFGTGGTIGESSLSLNTAIEVRLSNSALLRINPSENTFVSWDCNGFNSIGIDAEIEFCENIIVPIDENTNLPIEDERYTIEFAIELEDWSEFYLEVNPNTLNKFALANNTDYIFTLSNMVVDFSDVQSPTTSQLPTEYISPHYSNGQFDKSWHGFYAGQLSISLPSKISNQGAPITLGMDDLIIDGNGISALIFGENILDIEVGNIGGWPISIDYLELLVLKNNIKGGGLGGDLKIPILEDGLEYTASIYSGNKIDFTLSPNEENSIDMMLATVVIEPNSIVEVKYDDGDFLAQAILHGAVEITSDAEEFNIQIPDISFKNLTVSTSSPKLRLGEWRFKNQFSAKFYGFEINLKDINSVDSGDDVGLSFDLDLSLDKGIKLNAGGNFGIIGKEEINSLGASKWEFDRIEVNKFYIDAEFSAGRIAGFLEKYDEHELFGTGFMGRVDLTIKVLGTISAVGMFGNTNYMSDDYYKYFFVDAMAETSGAGIPLAPIPLSITGFSGGVSNRMFPNYDNLFISGAAPDFDNVELGESLTGIIYEPNPDIGLGFKGGILLALSASDKVLKASSSLQFLFNHSSNGGGLNQVNFDGHAQFMSSIPLGLLASANDGDESSEPNAIDAALKAYMHLNYNFNRKELHGKFAAFLSSPNDLLTGAGENNKLVDAEAHFASDKWYVNIGQPKEELRCGISVNIEPIGSLKLTSYLNVGTSVPDMPDIPSELRSLIPELSKNQTFRNSGAGFVFGSAVEISANLNFGIGSTSVDGGMGFDLMVRDFGDSYCFGDLPSEQIGFDGWYSMGQIWTYLNGSLEIANINIFDAGIAAVLKAQLPNPIAAQADVGIKVNTFFGGFDSTLKIRLGEECIIVSDDPDIGMEIISAIVPYNNSSEIPVDIYPVVQFNAPLETEFNGFDNSGNEVNYLVKYNTSSLTSELYGTLTYDIEYSSNMSEASLIPHVMFYENDTVDLTFTVDIFKNSELIKTETKSTSFYIGKSYDIIPETNVEFSYPVDGMFNYHKEEYNLHQGYIQLKSGMSELLLDRSEEYDLRVRFKKPDGTTYINDCIYDPASHQLVFEMPVSQFENGTAYEMSIMHLKPGSYDNYKEGNIDLDQPFGGVDPSSFFTGSGIGEDSETIIDPVEKTLFTVYFRVSNHNTFGEKIDLLNQQPCLGVISKSMYKSKEMELFDMVDKELISVNCSQNPWAKKFGDMLYAVSYPYYVFGGELKINIDKQPINKMYGLSFSSRSNINQTRFHEGWDTDTRNTRITFNQDRILKDMYVGMKSEINAVVEKLVDPNVVPYLEIEPGIDEDIDEVIQNAINQGLGGLLPVYQNELEPHYPGNYRLNVKYVLPGNVLVRTSNIDFTRP